MILLLLCLYATQTPDWAHHEPIPRPSGRYAVGVSTVYLVDSTRPTSRHIPVRPFSVQVWYPANTPHGTSPYLTEHGLLDSMIARGYLDLSAAEMRGWDTVRVRAVTRAEPRTPPTSDGWPVLILSHGLGVARAHYSALSAELASAGYVVLTLDHPLGGFAFAPDGKVLTPGVDSVPLAYGDQVLPSVVRDWAIDAGFVLRRLQGRAKLPRIDTTRAGMIGHSLGGAAALQACRSESLFKACADLDGDAFGDVERQGVGEPFLVLLSQPNRDRDAPPRDSAEVARRAQFAQMGRERDSTWAAICAHDTRAPCEVVKLKGTGHFSFSDAPFQAPSLLRDVGATLTPLQSHRLIAAKLEDFFREKVVRRR